MVGGEGELEGIILHPNRVLAEHVKGMWEGGLIVTIFFWLKFVLLPTVESTRTVPLTQQLGLSANRALAWLSAAGIVKKALVGGVVSGTEQARGGGDGMGPKVGKMREEKLGGATCTESLE